VARFAAVDGISTHLCFSTFKTFTHLSRYAPLRSLSLALRVKHTLVVRCICIKNQGQHISLRKNDKLADFSHIVLKQLT